MSEKARCYATRVLRRVFVRWEPEVLVHAVEFVSTQGMLFCNNLVVAYGKQSVSSTLCTIFVF